MTSSSALRPAVFLDRDGVLNAPDIRAGRPHPPSTVEEFQLLPGVAEACARLVQAGFALVVVTNQPDVARGTQQLEVIEAMHATLRNHLPLAGIYVCLHDDVDGCDCRKPRPGLILGAAQELGLDLTRSFCVGDRWRDVEAARRAGVKAVHIDWHYDEKSPEGADAVVGNLSEAADWILAAHKSA